MTSAFKLDKDDDTGMSLMVALLSSHIESPETHVRYYIYTFFFSKTILKNFILIYYNFSFAVEVL